MDIRELKITDLKPAEYNPRQSTSKQENQLKKSLQKFGMVEPIVVNMAKDREGTIVGGHFRVRELEKLGHTTVPCAIVNLSLEDERELNIRLNKNTGEFDFNLLTNNFEIQKLKEWGFEEIDFGIEEKVPEVVEDEPPELPETKDTISQKGDVWILGRHKLVCGDATNIDDVRKLMGDEKADCVFTSPPYNSGNVDFTYNYKSKVKTGGFYHDGNDDKSEEEYYIFCLDVLKNISLIVKEKLHCVFWNVSYNANSRSDYGKIIFAKENPLEVKETIIWDKNSAFPIAGDNILSRRCEFIFLLSKNKKYLSNQNKNTIYFNKWEIASLNCQDRKNNHKACFPIALPSKAISDFTQKDMIIFDPFGGSGSTLIACDQLDRSCRMMELDERYCDVIICRWQKLTKKKAVLEAKNKTYAKLKGEN